MSSTGDSLLKRTSKSLSLLAFETSKQSRILKKKMRITALQKDVKADLRDLGRIVYEAVLKSQDDVLSHDEVSILVENVTKNNQEIERLRESIERISRAKKTFEEEEFGQAQTVATSAPSQEVELEPVEEQADDTKEEEQAPEPEAGKEEATAKAEPEQAPEAEEEAQEEPKEEPVLEEKPKATRRKRTTTPRKRKTTKTTAKAKADEGDKKE